MRLLFLAKNDIAYPDQKLAVENLIEAETNLEIIDGQNMPHIWPLLPIMKEAKTLMNKLIKISNGELLFYVKANVLFGFPELIIYKLKI